MTYTDPTTPFGTIEWDAGADATASALPVKPARPPASCDAREFLAYRLADDAYRKAVVRLARGE